MRSQTRFFDGAEAKIHRLGLDPLLAEVEQRLQSGVVLFARPDRVSRAIELRQRMDALFLIEKVRGGKWAQYRKVGAAELRLEFRMRISSRREILYKDVLHLRRRLECGDIDLGVIIVPSDRLQCLLPKRTPSSSYAVNVVKELDADRFPIILIEIEHDGPGLR